MNPPNELEVLAKLAINLGATLSAIIASSEIQVKEELALLCNGEFVCPNYGLAAGCPPNVKGPEEFRRWQRKSTYAIVVRIEIPSTVMFSSGRNEIMQLLHHIVATLEREAVEAGYTQSRGFAGGSCKKLFCDSFTSCVVVEENKPCRHSELARPSMSGFGVDVIQLMKTSGWTAKVADSALPADSGDTSWVAGLVMFA